MTPEEQVATLLVADAKYQREVSTAYDDVLWQVVERIRYSGSIGKLDIAALTLWKRIRADTPWVAALMGMPDDRVREVTNPTVAAANDSMLDVSAAAGAARTTLTTLPGFDRGDALASAICFAAAPHRLAVYDQRAHNAIDDLGRTLDNRRGRYRRYMGILEDIRAMLKDAGHEWTARRVDTALYQLGKPTM